MNRLITATVAAACTIWLTPPAAAETDAPAQPLLTFEQALSLARNGQPSVGAFESEAAASEQAAVAARSLPDPQISGGIQNFPILRQNAFTLNDEMTMLTIGVMREQVRRSQREAEAARLRAEAVVSRFEGTAQQRKIQRDTMVAWVDAVEARAKQRLLDRVISDLKVGRQVMEAGIPTGSATPALELQAQAEIGLAESQLAEARGAEERARAELGRWIGAAAQRALPDVLPKLAPPAGAPGQPSFSTHPEILAATAREEAARRQVDVRLRERRPNISWQVMLGTRPKYGEMISGQISVPLQLNQRNLQSRQIGEAQALADAARLRTEDTRRELASEYRAALASYASAEAQIGVLRDRVIPSLEASFKASEARYASGQGTLELPLNIVRRYVEANVQLVEQEGARERAAAELLYVSQDDGR